MRKVALTVVAGCMSAAVAGAFAESAVNRQDTAIQLAQSKNPASSAGVRTPAQPNESGAPGAEMRGMMMKEGMMMVVMPDGRTSTMQMSDKMMSDMMMKEGKPMTGAHMMMMSGGKMYMMEDKKMADGKMMSDMMKK